MSVLLALVLQTAITQRTGEIRSPRIVESSGVAVSRAHPGLLWTHNDSGDRPYLYATDLAGRDFGALLVPGARALDWEDMALGPCPTGPLRRAQRDCVFIGDVGDNVEARPLVTVYALPEPQPPTSPADTMRTTGAPAVLRLRYPNGSHDVEAIYVAPRDGALFLISKGRSGAIHLYRVDRASWAGDTVVTATLVQDLPIRPDGADGHWITGAAIRPDGRMVAVRTELAIYFFTPGVGGRLVPTYWPVCPVRGDEYLGEAVDFLDDSTLVVTSESARGHPGTIHTVRCPTAHTR